MASTMIDTAISDQRFRIFDKISRTGAIGVLFWIGIIICSLAWNLHVHRSSTMNKARQDADATYKMEEAYWSHLHGLASIAFYDIQDDKDQILSKISHRSITTTVGRTFELAMIPYFAEHLHEELEDQSGIKIHRTSLHPLGKTFPDAWESAALTAFHEGTPEVCSVETLSGKPYLRLMRPFQTQQMCTRCHGDVAGNKVRGGVSVSVPLDELFSASAGMMHGIWTSHILGGLLGAALILFFTSRDQRTTRALRKSQQGYIEFLELVETSRQAGMAEIATSVLHNVGNVLNSVNVSSNLVMEKLHRFGVADLCKAADLIEAHQDDLGEYVTHDEHGQHLGDFLVAQSRQMAAEEDNMIQEMQSLLKNIEHIKEIVVLQQEHAGLSGLIQKVSLQDVLQDAIEINCAAMQRRHIQLTREFQDLPPAMVDKQKILQIVINLISNAKQALDHMDPKDRHLIVRLYQVGAESVRIEVSDNGMGIPAENLTKIFAHGFTTKKDGHGFGLHGAILQAKEIGGSLTASSDGPGTGATFTLELPFKSATVLEFAI